MKKILSIFLVILFLFVFSASDVFAATWGEHQPAGNVDANWISIASDDDGTNLIAAISNGRLYTSNNSGATWTERQPAGGVNVAWGSVASDADGTNLVATVQSGMLYTSSNSGATWAAHQLDADGLLTAVAMDADGSVIAASDGFGDVYVSIDSGETWTTRQPSGASDAYWDIAVDADGSVIIAGSLTASGVFISTNTGANWTQRQPTGAPSGNWRSVAVDADGSNLIAGSDAGNLYTSSNGGVDWTLRQPGGANIFSWTSLASDADGSHLLVAVGNGGTGHLYLSTDSGASWNEEQPGGVTDRLWSVSLDGDGSHLVVVGYNGRLYVSPDTAVPTVSSFTPTNNAVEVAVDATFNIVFNEDVATSTGNIVLKKMSDNSTVETIDVTSALVSIAGDTLSINPSVTLTLATEYYILIDAGAIEDLAGNAFAGIDDSTTWSFTADAPPTISTLNPANGATEVSRTDNTFQIGFNQNIVTNTGNITLYKTSDDSVVETFDVTDTNVVEPYERDVYLYSSATLDYETDYYFLIDVGALEDESGNVFAGITDATTWNFRADAIPVVSELSPADNTVGVALNANLTLTFDQEIFIRALDEGGPNGTISIIRSNGGTVLETISLYDVDAEGVDERISGNETTVITINPSSDLEYSKAYHVLVSADAFRDGQSTEFAGITDGTVWNFQTVAESVASNGTVSFSGRKSTGPDEEQANYGSLLAQLRVLIEQFIALGGTPSPAMLALLGGGESDYTRDLDLGMEGNDVLMLQNFLIAQNKGPAAQALAAHGVTDYFGPLTQAALAEFQASVGITPAVGYFGPVTRAYVNSL